MTVSIILCTRNRADSLALALESLSRTNVPEGWTVELLVIDNGSTDHTRQVVDHALLPILSLRYLFEPNAGLSHARNRGIKDARGEILLWVDDDIHVSPNWLEKMCQPILKNEADAGAGGVIFPDGISKALARLPDPNLTSWYASTHAINRILPERMVGANMVFHRRVLEKVPGFDIELGPGAAARGFGEETLFSRQLKAAGYRITGLFDVRVEHHFDLSRLTKGGLLDAARKMGRTDAYLEYHWSHDGPRRARLKLMLSTLWRVWIRIIDRLIGYGPYLISASVVQAERKIAYYREYIDQRGGPRRYALRGLAPRQELSNL
jgi:glycosyltransferase involved in cell wall biosynthesis